MPLVQSRRPVLIAIFFAAILAISMVLAVVGAISSSAYNSAQPNFGTPINLSNDDYNASYPWVANVGSHVYVSWTEEDHGIYFRYSPDNGTTWYPPLSELGMRISSPGGTTTYPIIAASGSDVYVTWSQSAETSGSLSLQIFFAASTNYGQNFSAAQQLTSGSSVNGFITPVIATTGQYVYVAYTGNSKNSYVMANDKFGAAGSWTSPFHYSATHEPQLAAVGENGYAVADGVAVAVTHNGGQTWVDTINNTEEGDEPWIAASGSYVYVVSQTKTTNGIIHAIISSNYGDTWSPVLTLSGDVSDAWEPQMVASGNYVYVVFHSLIAPIADWMTVSSNNGKTWSTPLDISNSNPLVGWATQIATTGCGGGYSCSTNQSNYVFTQWPVYDKSANTWNMFSSMSSNYGASWTAAPGVEVSSNLDYSSVGPNDIATSSVAAFANHEFIVWTMCQQCGQNHNITLQDSQVMFVVSSPNAVSTTSTTSTSDQTTTSSSPSTSVTTIMSTTISTASSSSSVSSSKTSITSSSTVSTSSSASFAPPTTTTSSAPARSVNPLEIYAAIIIASAIVAASGIVYVIGFRKAPIKTAQKK